MKGKLGLASLLFLLCLQSSCCPDYEKFDGQWSGTVSFPQSTCVPNHWPVTVTLNVASPAAVSGVIDVDAPEDCIWDAVIVGGNVDPTACGVIHLTFNNLVTRCDWEISDGDTRLNGTCADPLQAHFYDVTKEDEP